MRKWSRLKENNGEDKVNYSEITDFSVFLHDNVLSTMVSLVQNGPTEVPLTACITTNLYN